MDRPGLASRPAIKGEERQNDGGGLDRLDAARKVSVMGQGLAGGLGSKVALPYRRFGFTLTGPLTGAHRKLGRRLAWRPSSIIDVSLVRCGQARRLSGGRSFARARTCKGGTRHDAFGIYRAHPGPGAGDHRPRTPARRRDVPGHGRGVPAQRGAGLFLRPRHARRGPCHPQCASSLDARLAKHHHGLRLALRHRRHLQDPGAKLRCRGSASPSSRISAGRSWAPSSRSRSARFLSVMGYQDIWQAKRRVHHRTSAAKSSTAASRSAKRPRRKSRCEGR